MKEDNNITVTIRCLTYNHEPYIRQCLEGFVMQQTNFKFEAIVHDDASTDGTAAIVREYAEKYPDIIKPIFQTENQYSKRDGSIRRIMNEHIRGKYIAMCEGDDYWIDPLKLQKQVDFLEENEEYGMCYTNLKYLYQKDNKISLSPLPFYKSTSVYKLIERNHIATPTVLLKSDIYFRYNNEICPENFKWPMGDYPLWIYTSIKSKISGLSDITTIYRCLEESASHSSNINKIIAFRKASGNICLYFNDKFNLGLISAKNVHARYIVDSIFLYCRQETLSKTCQHVRTLWKNEKEIVFSFCFWKFLFLRSAGLVAKKIKIKS